MSIYKRASGRYAVLVDLESTGPRRRRSLGTFATKKEAEKAEREALTARDRGIDVAPARLTMQALFERFMLARAHEHSPTTAYGYRAAWKRCAPIAGVPVEKLRPAHLSALYAQLATSGRHDGAALSPKSVGHTVALVSALLRYALDLELVGRNVAAVKAAKPERRRSPNRARAYDAADAARLVAEADSTRYGPLVVVAFTTGLRRGELAGLRWADIDFDRATAMISRAVVKLPKEAAIVKDTKTHLVATIALSAAAVEALRRQRAAQAKERLAAGEFFDDQDYVFAGPLGGVPSPGGISHAIRRIAKRANTTLRGVHAMRHSTASWMLREGADIRTVQAVLRHSAASTTLNTYAHEIEGAQAAAVAHVDRYLIAKPDTPANPDGNRLATVTSLGKKKARQ
jgi:integrase